MSYFTKNSLKLIFASLMLVTLPSFAADNDVVKNTLSASEKAQIESVVHDYLMNKPEVLVDAMQVLQKKQMDQAQVTIKDTEKDAKRFSTVLFRSPNDPVSGNVNGKITVTEFFDYQCPHCVKMVPVLDNIIKNNPNVRLVFKEFPIRGPMSETAARAALAANKQGKYAIFSHKLIAFEQPLTAAVIFNIAQSVGLNVEQLKKDMQDPSISKQLEVTAQLAQDLKLFGTPALFIGKTNGSATDKVQYAPGSINEKELQNMIDKA